MELYKKLKMIGASGLETRLNKSLVLLGMNYASQLNDIEIIASLQDVGFRIYSQFDEDGILEWLIRQLPISSERFVEFGVEDYHESNTRFLLENRNWEGLVIDSNPKNINIIQNDEIYWKHSLLAHCEYVTPDNINLLLEEAGFTGNIGVLSIDVDGMDYWIWQAIDLITPDIVICEYNAVLGDLFPLSVPYQHDFNRTKAHYSNLYWGASIKAYMNLAETKGYLFAGSNRAGHNAFFVKKELFHYIDKKIESKNARNSTFRESRSPQGDLTFLSGMARFEAIEHLNIIRLDTGEELELKALSPVYSATWLK